MDHKELFEILHGLTAGLPPRLLRYYLSNLGALSAQGWHVQGCIMALKAGIEGAKGNEPPFEPGRRAALARDLDEMLAELLEEGALDYGGEVISLGGGWALALFTGQDNAARCLAAALSARDAAISWSGPVGGLSFACKAGISEGRIYTGLLGNLELRATFLAGGSVVDAAMQAAEMAGPGEVIVGPGATAKLAGRYRVARDRGELKVAGNLLRFVEKSRFKPTSIELKETDELESAVRALAAYVPGNDPFNPISSPPPPEYGPACVLCVILNGIDFDIDAGSLSSDLDLFFRTMVDFTRSRQGILQKVSPVPGGAEAVILFSTKDPEKDARAAALTGIELLRFTSSMPMSAGLKLGMAQGEVFRGAVGTPRIRGYAAHGEAVYRASELAQASRPGQILSDGSVSLGRIKGLSLRSPSPGQVEGIAHLIDTSIFPGETLTLLRSGSPKALIGRKTELEQCNDAIGYVLEGKAKALLIQGGAGTGKTRILDKLITNWKVQGGVWRRVECLPENKLMPLQPWWEFLKEVFALQPGDSPGDIMHKLESGLSRMPRPLGRWAGLVAQAAGWARGEPALEALKPRIKRGILFDLIHAIVRNQAANRPFMLVFDNLHWADQTSVELLEFMAGSLPEIPVLLCASFRPSFNFKAGRPGRRTMIKLTVQKKEDGLSLLSTVLGGREPIPEVLDAIWEKAHGNPGALLELVRLLQATGKIPSSRDKKKIRTFMEYLYREVPDGLEALVAARLNNLNPKLAELLKSASVIGSRFEMGLLRSVVKSTRLKDLLEGLEVLEETGWIHKVFPARTLTYGFTRPVAQEAISKELLLAEKKGIHDRLAGVMEDRNKSGKSYHPELLAFHLAAGNFPHRAFAYSMEAGSKAASIGANLTALDHLELASSLLERQDLGQDVPREDILASRIELGLLKSSVLTKLARFEEALHLLEHTEEYAVKAGDEKSRITAKTRRLHLMAVSGRAQEVIALFKEVLNEAENAGEQLALVTVLKAQTEAFMRLGRMEDALSSARKELNSVAGLNKPDLLADVRSRNARILGIRGDLAKSAAMYSDALSSYRQAGDKFGETECLNSLGTCHKRQGDLGRALLAFGQGLRLGEDLGVRPAAAVTLSYIGDIYRMCNMPNQAMRNHREALDLLDWIGEQESKCRLLSCLARDYTALGKFDKAIVTIEDSLELADILGIRMAKLDALLCRYQIVFRKEGDRADLSGLEEVIKLADSLSAAEHLAGANHLAGQQYLFMGRRKSDPSLLKKAVKHLEIADLRARASVDVTIRWPILYHMGLALQAMDDQTKARTFFDESRSMVITIADSIADPGMRNSFLQSDLARAALNAVPSNS
ncbi:MAG: AAA family ATPase [Deltaproteobacteria bacterium]|nr:AAA family ATPase [Deltaproteobacteria bacterium]